MLSPFQRVGAERLTTVKTLQDRLVAALLATGCTIAKGSNAKRVKLTSKYPGCYWYCGANGSFRYGKNFSVSHTANPTYKAALLNSAPNQRFTLEDAMELL